MNVNRRSIIYETMKEKIESEIKRLVEISYRNHKTLNPIGVLGGQSGVALFQFYASKYFNEYSYAEQGTEILLYCLEKINRGLSYPTFCNGISGFGWAIQHLQHTNFIDINTDELLCPFDDYLHQKMKIDLLDGDYDFLHGAIGYGYYFLERYKRTKNNKLKKKYLDILEELITSLENLSIVEKDTIKWERCYNKNTEPKTVNFGLSHGMSSIIIFLIKIYEIPSLKKISKKLLVGGINFIKSYENKTGKGISIFPKTLQPNQKIVYNGRIAWCHGDLGVGLSLLVLGQKFKDDSLVDYSLKILLNTTKKKDDFETKVNDIYMCHGAFGIMKFYNSIYKLVPLNEFSKSEKYWMKDGFNRKKNSPYRKNLDILDGISGIGLSLIDILSIEPNYWDECLMLS